MDDTLLLMQISDRVRDLQNDMSRELFREVRELDDLVKQLAAFHQPAREKVTSAAGLLELGSANGTYSRV
ncbi:MAG: hypothetical protein LBE64_22670, partial [Acinetobacter pittii]|nr:hypothetical protein [Acinetobacter pittii]